MTSKMDRVAAALQGADPLPVSVPADEWVPVVPVPDSAPALDVLRTVEGRRRGPDFSWRYANAEGRTLGFAVRWNLADGDKAFNFATWCRSAGGAEAWRLKHLPAPRPLYGLDRFAANADAPVVVCEGKKAADAAARVFQKSVCTTSPAGANAAGKADWSPLAGRRVLIIPDYDQPGRRYAQDVAKILCQIGVALVSIADLAGLAARDPVASFDIADAVAEGWAPEDLRRQIMATAVAFEVPAVRQYVTVDGFEMSDRGLFVDRVVGTGDKQRVETVAVSAAFEVLGRARNPQGEGWSRRIRWADPDGRLHVAMVVDADLMGEVRDLAKRLAGKRLRIERGVAGALANYLNRADVSERVTIVSATGWNMIEGRQMFVLPGGAVSGGSNVICDVSGAGSYEASGSLAGWRDGVGHLLQGIGAASWRSPQRSRGLYSTSRGATAAASMFMGRHRAASRHCYSRRPRCGARRLCPVSLGHGGRRRTRWKLPPRYMPIRCLRSTNSAWLIRVTWARRFTV